MTDIKFCGLRTEEDVQTAVEFGARWIGLVHFEKSPRHVPLAQMPPLLAASGRAQTVAVTVDAEDALLAELARAGFDAIQLHGSETPSRLVEIRSFTGCTLIKALPVAEADDLAAASAFEGIADLILFDAKPPQGADRPGGWGETYDYALLKQLSLSTPWILSGGLTPDNVCAAVEASGALAVDVSSGIESAPGVKSAAGMRAFAKALG